jgi:hypothetical protein
VSLLRQVFTRLMRLPAASVEQIAEEISRVLRRNEESRIYSWWSKAKRYPPSRKGEGGEVDGS